MSRKPQIIIENGFRKVSPYIFDFKTHAKSRWVGRTLADIMIKELGQEESIIEKEIREGLIYISNNHGRKGTSILIKDWNILKERIVERHDIIYHSRHMHEPNIPWPEGDELLLFDFGKAFSTVYQDSDILVVNKPPGVPSHPKSNFRYNTATEITKRALHLKNVWLCHRLDKATSGILILALNRECCKEITEMMQTEGSVRKEYLARVKGEFPEKPFYINCPIFLVNISGGYLMPSNETKQIPLAITQFERITYNKDLNESIVICRPITGRTHQIRIHLRNIGFPISNDYMYNPVNKDIITHEVDLIRNNLELHMYNLLFSEFPEFQEQSSVIMDREGKSWNIERIVNFRDITIQRSIELIKKARVSYMKELMNRYGKLCETCHRYYFGVDTQEKGIYLHSWKYTMKKKNANKPICYEAQPPSWSDI